MPGKEPEYGPTAQTVAKNLQRLRTVQTLNYKGLSDRLKAVAAWDISPTAIRRMEEGKRRVTVDDLVALALTLNCSPLALLLPPAELDYYVTITGAEKRPGYEVWEWGRGKNPILLAPMLKTLYKDHGPSDQIRAAKDAYQLYSLPALQGKAGQPNIFGPYNAEDYKEGTGSGND